ncbi:upstream activation factor subunit spp27-like [Andrographis paniculata]|uniref:upstream activation factor subunit spp27-like n=1 Tax=Andrographis paniculata TaxID=175694 RepID=UPI0021E8FB18|nr:upstream activation factor subunit spp27-like [Andrographis paniculata]
MASDSQLIERLREFLSTSDLNKTTTAIVRRQLEEDFGIDLSDRKAFIREQVDVYLQNQFENAAADNEGRVNDEGDAEDEVEGPGEEDPEEEGGGGGEEEEEEEATEASNSNSSSRKRPRKTKESKRRGGGGGFTKVCSLSPELQKFTGAAELARTEVVKQLWAYIKENKLQDPSNRRNIICDNSLRKLFNVDTIDMFQMNKALAKHIWPLDSDGAPVNSAPKETLKKEERDEDEPERKEKRQKGGKSAFLAPIKLSDALIKFLGTGESELSRSDVVKRMWDYIKLNNLQDPADKRQIICDEKLKELLNVDKFHGFSVTKLLTGHFIKAEQ